MTGSFFRIITHLGALLAIMAPGMALAQDGHAADGQIGLQHSVTPIMDSILAFHDNLLMWIISIITAFVLLLLLIVMVRFNRRANPTPSKTTHNVFVEVVWTVVPILILIVIAVPSFGVLADQMTVPDGERKYLGSDIFSGGSVEVPAPTVTIKATGYQWYWGYEYVVDEEGASNVGFDSIILGSADNNYVQTVKPNQPRLLAVDNELVVPVNTTVRVQVTAADVIHAFAVPSFGIKTDAVPGRLNETWFHARKTGIYYGQCSELCGKDHAYMPIAIRVVSQEQYNSWISAAADDLAGANRALMAAISGSTKLADAGKAAE